MPTRATSQAWSKASLSRAAQDVFSSEASLTNRSGKFCFIFSPRDSNVDGRLPACKEQLGKKVEATASKVPLRRASHPVNKLSPRVAPCSPKLSPRVASCSPKQSPRVAVTEPDAEPDLLEERLLKEQHRRSEDERKLGAELRSLHAQLTDAREQSERLKASQSKHSADMLAERKRRLEAEEQATKMQFKCSLHEQSFMKFKIEKRQLAKENATLERKLLQLRKGMGRKSTGVECDTDRLAAHIAEKELEPLRQCAVEDKGALTKRLLLKWHPDKQPSNDHSKFATRVLQEMQNCPAWPK